MEDFVLVALARELREQLGGLTLQSVQQAGMTELVFTAARGPGRIAHLLVSLSLSEPLAYLIDDQRRAALGGQETPFTARLMRLIADSEIREVVKQPYDRVLRGTVTNPYLAERPSYHLYAELIQQGANLFLTDAAGTVIEAFHSDFDRHRALAPGGVYAARPQGDKADPLECAEVAFYERMGDLGQPPWQWEKTLTRRFGGVSPTVAREVVARSGEDRRHLWEAFRDVLGDVYQRPPAPRVYQAPEAAGAPAEPRRVLSTIELRHRAGWTDTRYLTANAAAQAYYDARAEEQALRQLTAEADRILRGRRVRLERLIEHLDRSRAEFGGAEALKQKGELLLANLYRLQPSYRPDPQAKSVTVSVENYCVDPPAQVELELDPTVSLQANAERFFQQYRKARRGLQTLEKKIPAVRRELDRLAAQEEAVRGAATADARREMVAALAANRPIRHQRVEIHKARRQVEEVSLRRFLSSDRFEILVGRSSRENDQLTFRVAAPNDVWMHAADYPGSHVVIRNPQKAEVPARTVRQAAQIAAYYSQARKNGKVMVHHTLRKYVHKPKHAAPGLVTLSQFKSLTVEPKKAVNVGDEE